MKNKALDLLKRLRATIDNSSVCHLVYISPAQQLRNQADRMEQKEQLLREIDEFLKDNTKRYMQRLNSEDAQFGVYLSENTQEIQEWEKEFDEKFNNISRSKFCIYINSPEREREFQDIIKFCKSFISQKLKEQRSEIIQIIKQHSGEDVAQILHKIDAIIIK
jgi:cytoplasmic iron level regulating protein YaaA (DUF328/UPF0246 family)